jgi:hypothetical protein
MAAATTPRLGIDRRLVSIGSAGVREIQHFNRYLVDFLSAEFALKPGRVRLVLGRTTASESA